MKERRLDSYEFYNGTEALKFPVDRLFGAEGTRLEEVWVLTAKDGTETEAVLPIEEYQRLKSIERLVRKLRKKYKGRDGESHG